MMARNYFKLANFKLGARVPFVGSGLLNGWLIIYDGISIGV